MGIQNLPATEDKISTLNKSLVSLIEIAVIKQIPYVIKQLQESGCTILHGR